MRSTRCRSNPAARDRQQRSREEGGFMATATTTTEAIRTYLGVYQRKDRSAIEQVLADDFTFTSPVDDHIDRALYFVKCWPKQRGCRLGED
jgi:hypothetical protein